MIWFDTLLPPLQLLLFILVPAYFCLYLHSISSSIIPVYKLIQDVSQGHFRSQRKGIVKSPFEGWSHKEQSSHSHWKSKLGWTSTKSSMVADWGKCLLACISLHFSVLSSLCCVYLTSFYLQIITHLNVLCFLSQGRIYTEISQGHIQFRFDLFWGFFNFFKLLWEIIILQWFFFEELSCSMRQHEMR